VVNREPHKYKCFFLLEIEIIWFVFAQEYIGIHEAAEDIARFAILDFRSEAMGPNLPSKISNLKLLDLVVVDFDVYVDLRHHRAIQHIPDRILLVEDYGTARLIKIYDPDFFDLGSNHLSLALRHARLGTRRFYFYSHEGALIPRNSTLSANQCSFDRAFHAIFTLERMIGHLAIDPLG
jgi:hypothetical protein